MNFEQPPKAESTPIPAPVSEKTPEELKKESARVNFYDKFNNNEQEAVQIMSALAGIKREMRKPEINKDDIDQLITVIEGHLEDMLQENKSDAYKEMKDKRGSLDSLARMIGNY